MKYKILEQEYTSNITTNLRVLFLDGNNDTEFDCNVAFTSTNSNIIDVQNELNQAMLNKYNQLKTEQASKVIDVVTTLTGTTIEVSEQQ